MRAATMAPGNSKLRRHESLDLTPDKVVSRQRSSAPGIMTSVYKRPLLSSRLDSPARLSQTPKSSRIRKPAVQMPLTVRTEPPPDPLDQSPLPAQPSPALTQSKTKVAEVIPKVIERSRRGSESASSRDDKSGINKVSFLYFVM